MSQIFDSTDERYITRYVTGQMRSVIVQRTFRIWYIFVLSVIHPFLYGSPLVDSSLPVACPLHNTYALLLRFCAPYTFREDPHRHRDDFHHRINTG